MASSVPRFASFRPKPKEPKEPAKAPPDPVKSDRHGKEKSRDDKTRSREPEKSTRNVKKSANKLFFSDRRGDRDILQYGTLNRYDIPAYRRYGSVVLGLSPDLRIDWELTTDKKIYITPVGRRRQERLLTDRQTSRESRRAIRFVKPSESQPDLDQDYISFSKIGKRKRDYEEDTMGVDYRVIGQEREANALIDPDTKYDSDLETGDIDSEVTEKNSNLIRKTRDHPEDIQAWLDLIHHQEAMMKIDRSFTELRDSDRRNLAEIRISIYEEAIKKTRNNHDGEMTLLLGLTDEASIVWDEAKLAKKWEDVITKYPKNLGVWLKYLDFSQTRFTAFRYESCRATFFRCLGALRSNSTSDQLEGSLHVLIRLTSMIQEAGYQELAIAIWQALLEVTHLQPHGLTSQSRETLLALFEEFWESEAPRIGEHDAKGWREFNADENIPSVPGPRSLKIPDPDISIFRRFRMREVDSTAILRYPGRTADDVGGEDPFHLILFSDLEEYLKIITPVENPGALILEAFLCFCGLPPFPRVNPHQRQWWTDPFLKRKLSLGERHDQTSGNFQQTLAKFSDCSLKGIQLTTELLFEQDFPVDHVNLDTGFIQRLLRLLAFDSTKDETIGEYLLAFELKHYPSDAFRTAKRLLKARPSSLRLYNAYGLVESRRGNSTKADQVFSAALSMQNTDTPLSTLGSLQLFYSWVWEALRRQEKVEAYWRLVSPHGQVSKRQEGSHPEQSTLLRGQTTFTNIIERSLLGQDYFSAILCSELLSLLTYLSSGEKPEMGLSVHHNLSKWFADHKLSQSPYAELHAQAVARFLAYHATHAQTFKPALLRGTLEPLITNFPGNTFLLSVYAANEARFTIDDRVRDTMYQKALQVSEKASIASFAFAIYYERLRGETSGATSHSIRSLYKRASESVGKHCPGLWKSWIEFELVELDRERSRLPNKGTSRSSKKSSWETRIEDSERRVKETFYIGVRRLPWCKDFLMLGFTELLSRGLWTEDELWRLYNVMVEKEMRIYAELDETAA